MDTHLKEKLSISAFTQAINRENPEPGLVVHTDRGPQYTSDEFLQTVKKHGGISSMGCKGNPYDNALMNRSTEHAKCKYLNILSYITIQRENTHPLVI